MSDENPNDRLTSAEIRKQIEQAKAGNEQAKTDVKASGLPLTGQIASEINASANSIPDVPPPAASKPDPAKPAAKGATGESAVDLKEWAKRRGIDWTTEDSVLSALRKSDQAFHAKRQQEKAREAVERPQPGYPAWTPPPASPPPYQPYANPAYQPSPLSQRQVVENIARQYNWTPEDVERVAPFLRDFTEAQMGRYQQQMKAEVEAIRKENEKNSVFRELSSDPVFRRPEVAMEYHSVLDQMQESDPQSFEQDPSAYKRAYDRALMNIARRNLEGRPLPEGVPPQAMGMTPPSTPPRPLGNGSGGGYAENENGVDPKEFAKLSSKDKRALLERMGLVQQY